MADWQAFRNRALSLLLTLALTLGTLSLFAPKTEALVMLPFVAALLKVLPSIPTILDKLKSDKKTKPTAEQTAAINKIQSDSENSKTDLAAYAVREQIVWRIVSASGYATTSVAKMIQISGNKSALTPGDIHSLSGELGYVKQGVDVIVKSDPKTSAFGTDALQITAIDNLLNLGPPTISDIEGDLKYDPKKPEDASMVGSLQTHLQTLNNLFLGLNQATATEIKMLAEGLAAVSAPKAPKSDAEIKKASDDAAKKGFGGDSAALTALDTQIAESTVALQRSVQAEAIAYQKLPSKTENQ